MSQRATSDEQKTAVLTALHDLAARLLEMAPDDLDVNAQFLDVGADSIVLINFIRAIEEHFGVKIRIRQVFEELKTLALLGEHIARHMDPERLRGGDGRERPQAARPAPAGIVATAPSLDASLQQELAMNGLDASGAGAIEQIILRQLTMFAKQLEILNGVRDGTPVADSRVSAAPTRRELMQPQSHTPAASTKDGGTMGFWTRSRTAARGRSTASPPSNRAATRMEFSLYYFGCYDDSYQSDKYELLIQGTKYADGHGFKAVWVPERHFTSFGGISPSPAVVAAALARETTRIQLRSGSVVMPLNHPARIAEEWSVVDNLSGGRVGLGIASGWHPRDFILAPHHFGTHREYTFEAVEPLKKLWRGESLCYPDGNGKPAEIRIYPKPLQENLPLWLTIVNNPDTYIKAGELGLGVLTNLMGQTPEDLERNIGLYQQALRDNGHAPETAKVAVLLHTYIEADAETAMQKAKRPLMDYFNSTVAVFQSLVKAQGLSADFDTLGEDDKAYIFEKAFDRYVETSALIGSPDSCAPLIDRLKRIGVTEVACLVDFGMGHDDVLRGLEGISALLEREPGDTRDAGRMEWGEMIVPLTPMQRQMWLLSQMGEGASAAYNEGVVLEFRGALSLPALKDALQKVVDRHESLRGTVDGVEGVLRIHPKAEVSLEFADLRGLSEAEQRLRTDDLLRAESRHVFDMSEAPMFRPLLIRLEEERYLFSLTDHHVVSDGWSMGVILREIGEIYSAARTGAPGNLATAMQYSAYVAMENESARIRDRLEHERYWLDQYADPVPVLELPTDYARPPVKTFHGARHSFRLDRPLTSALRQTGGSEGCTLFMVIFAAYAILVHRLSRQDDIVVGIPVAGRLFEGSDRLVGYCLNLLPVRSRIAGAPSFLEYLSLTRELLLGAYEHQDYPFSSLLEKVAHQHDASRSPIASTVLTYNEQTIKAPKMEGLSTAIVAPPIEFAKYDVHLIVLEENGELLMSFDYNTDLFEAATIESMADGFQELLRAIAATPRARIQRLPVMSKEERTLLLGKFRGAAVPYPSTKRLHTLFEERVQAGPAREAVHFQGETLDYAELNRRANRLARDLIAKGVARSPLVGLCAERSIDMIVGILGILKSGAAYVPLDPAFPSDRLKFIAEDAGVRYVVSQPHLRAAVPASERYSVLYFGEVGHDDGKKTEDPQVDGTSEDLAYVMYTSGSTGVPKGVAVRHRNAVRVVKGADYVDFGEEQSFLQFTPFTFDVSIFEIFGALLNGGRLMIFPPHVPSMAELGEFIAESGVTTAWLTAGLFHQMVDENISGIRTLRQLVAGGDALSAPHIRRVLQAVPTCRLVNGYGPTEAAVFACAFHFRQESELRQGVPIGKPIGNTYAYVLDENREPLPIGVPGELHIGGDAVTQGYWNRPELTAEKYVEDPYSETPGARMYRSGDIVKFMRDGNLLYLGRRDNQVKVRGFRIELGEIETVLAEHPRVQETAVLARSDNGAEKRLVAYVSFRKDGPTPSVSELRRYVAEHLPEYMVPSVVVTMESFPLNHNGKINRHALPASQGERPDLAVEHVAPGAGMERIIADAWSGVLGMTNIGVNDNFFDLGGTSLSMAKVHARLQSRVGRDVSMVDLFQYPTIAALAAYLEKGATVNAMDEVAERTQRRKTAQQKKRDRSRKVVLEEGRE